MQIREYHLHKDDDARLHFDLFTVGVYCRRNDPHAYRAHQHSYYQMIWFSEPGHHYIDYEIIRHPANALLFINKRQVHHFCKASSNEGYLYHFDEVFLRMLNDNTEDWIKYKLFNELGTPYVVLDAAQQRDFQLLTNLLKQELVDRSYNYRAQVFHLFHTLLLKTERIRHLEQGAGSKQDAGFILAMQFKQQIEAHMEQFLSVQEYSTLLGLSSKKLSYLCKVHLGDTPANIIRQRKILEAKRLLSNLKMSIKEIAYALGFDQPTYFTKYFKKHTGLTPKAFIKNV